MHIICIICNIMHVVKCSSVKNNNARIRHAFVARGFPMHAIGLNAADSVIYNTARACFVHFCTGTPHVLYTLKYGTFYVNVPNHSEPFALPCCFFWIRKWSHVATNLLVHVVILLLLVGATSSRSLKASFQTGPVWDLAGLLSSSIKSSSIEGVGFLIWRHNFKMAAMKSFHAEKCCRLVNEHTASAGVYAAAFTRSWCIVQHSYLLSGTDLISSLLLILLFFLFLLERPLPKSLRFSCFKTDWDGIWHECSSSSKHASIDGVGF